MIVIYETQSDVLYDTYRLNFYLYQCKALLLEDRRNNFIKKDFAFWNIIEPNIKDIITNTPLSKRFDDDNCD